MHMLGVVYKGSLIHKSADIYNRVVVIGVCV